MVGMHRPTYEGVWAVFQALFKQYGLPKQIHSDNGEPFASAVSLSRLTRLAVGFMDLGIVPVYSDPGHPEHNGSHERMHEELKAEATKPPAYSLGRQQRKFDAFRQDYNEQRPHQALGQRKPAQLYRRSSRSLPRRIEGLEVPAGHGREVRLPQRSDPLGLRQVGRRQHHAHREVHRAGGDGGRESGGCTIETRCWVTLTSVNDVLREL